MRVERTKANTRRVWLDEDERRAILGALGWVISGPFAGRYELWARPEFSREHAESTARRLSPDEGRPAEGPTELSLTVLDLLAAVLDAALDGDHSLPPNDWEILTTASGPTAQRLHRDLQATLNPS
jgi:hypothetical protein